MKRLLQGFLLVLLAAGLIACGPARKSVFPPTVTIQQLSVLPNGQWLLTVRIQNNSYGEMDFTSIEASCRSPAGTGPRARHVRARHPRPGRRRDPARRAAHAGDEPGAAGHRRQGQCRRDRLPHQRQRQRQTANRKTSRAPSTSTATPGSRRRRASPIPGADRRDPHSPTHFHPRNHHDCLQGPTRRPALHPVRRARCRTDPHRA